MYGIGGKRIWYGKGVTAYMVYGISISLWPIEYLSLYQTHTPYIPKVPNTLIGVIRGVRGAPGTLGLKMYGVNHCIGHVGDDPP